MSARVYVGTYGKYAAGSIEGKWLSLDDYEDKDAFLAACAELHKDEHDPEFMFQDFEGFPRAYYGESGLSDELWDWLALSEDDQELLAVYIGYFGEGSIEDARRSFAGKFDSEEDWAVQFLDNTGFFTAWRPQYGDTRAFDNWVEQVERYFDFEAYAQDCRLNGDPVFVEHDGDVWVFSRN